MPCYAPWQTARPTRLGGLYPIIAVAVATKRVHEAPAGGDIYIYGAAGGFPGGGGSAFPKSPFNRVLAGLAQHHGPGSEFLLRHYSSS